MSMIRWDPFNEVAEMRRAMGRFAWEPWLFSEEPWLFPLHRHHALVQEFTPLNAYQTDEDLVVKVALPGVEAEDVEISITGDSLNIKGEIKAEQEVEREDYFCQECHYGTFSRTLLLPIPVKAEKAEATFERGILTITIPKSEEIKPKTIKVKAAAETPV